MNGRGEKNFIALLNSQGFKCLHNLREKRVGDLGNDQSKDTTSSGHQRARLPVGVVSELLDSLPDPLCHLRVDGRILIDGA
jgi:hypothetical protein